MAVLNKEEQIIRANKTIDSANEILIKLKTQPTTDNMKALLEVVSVLNVLYMFNCELSITTNEMYFKDKLTDKEFNYLLVHQACIMINNATITGKELNYEDKIKIIMNIVFNTKTQEHTSFTQFREFMRNTIKVQNEGK